MISVTPFQYQYFFSAVGGSGSPFLVRSLLKWNGEVGDKPDNAFRPNYAALWSGDFNLDQGTFEGRAGGSFVPAGFTLEEILPECIEQLRDDPCRTVVFGTPAELGLLSAMRVSKVVFLGRHPLHAYALWAKPERHGDVIDVLGGVNAPIAAEFSTQRWTRATDELIRLADLGILGGVVRYEHAHSDAASFGLGHVFEDFDATKRNHGVLSAAAVDMLRHITQANFERIYEQKWHACVDFLVSSA